jgi:hypothetical protein
MRYEPSAGFVGSNYKKSNRNCFFVGGRPPPVMFILKCRHNSGLWLLEVREEFQFGRWRRHHTKISLMLFTCFLRVVLYSIRLERGATA